eukprot:2413179-Amphidinium_carterae.3
MQTSRRGKQRRLEDGVALATFYTQSRDQATQWARQLSPHLDDWRHPQCLLGFSVRQVCRSQPNQREPSRAATLHLADGRLGPLGKLSQGATVVVGSADQREILTGQYIECGFEDQWCVWTNVPRLGEQWHVDRLEQPSSKERLQRVIYRTLQHKSEQSREQRARVCESYPNLPTVPEEGTEEGEGVPMVEEEEWKHAAMDINAVPQEGTESEAVVSEQPSREQRAALLRAHRNLRHPPLQEFLRALRLAQVRPSVRKWVKESFRCEECNVHRAPSLRRPAVLPRSYAFNKVVGVDCLQLSSPLFGTEWWVNCVCWGTRFKQLEISGDGGDTVSAKCW